MVPFPVDRNGGDRRSGAGSCAGGTPALPKELGIFVLRWVTESKKKPRAVARGSCKGSGARSC